MHYGCANFIVGDDIIIRRSTKEREWQTFGHELGHYLRHCGNQYVMHHLFYDLQEYQADHFAYHFCVPTFMLDKLQLPNCRNEAIGMIAETFGVTYEFAAERLNLYEKQIFSDMFMNI